MSPARRTSAAKSLAMLSIAVLLTGCTATSGHTPAGVSTHFATGVLAAEQNLGSTADQRAVRVSTIAALTDENGAFVVHPKLRGREPAAVLTALTDTAATRERNALLGRGRTRALAAGLEASFLFYARQEFGSDWNGSGSRTAWLDRDVWASSTFHVDRWQGVRVTTDTARVLVRGEDRGTAWGGTSRRDAWAQYKLVLRRDTTTPNGWRVIHQQAASTAA